MGRQTQSVVTGRVGANGRARKGSRNRIRNVGMKKGRAARSRLTGLQMLQSSSPV